MPAAGLGFVPLYTQPTRYSVAVHVEPATSTQSHSEHVCVQLIHPAPCAFAQPMHSAVKQAHVEQLSLVQLVHPAPYFSSQETQDPEVDGPQPSRNWFDMHVSAPLIEQSRASQCRALHIVQPAPCEVSHEMHAPALDVVQPKRY